MFDHMTESTASLRPVERIVLKLRADGVDVEEIATRIKRSASHVERIIDWSAIPRQGTDSDRDLRPIERRVLDLRAEGETHHEIGMRFNKGERYIRQVEGLAHFKEADRLLTR